MVYKIYRFFIKIVSLFELILINILFVCIIFLCSKSTFSMVISIERNIAYKYCDSIEKNLFKGLDNETILKYKYFFSSINTGEIKKNLEISNFSEEVYDICAYKLSNEEKENINKMFASLSLKDKN